MQPGHPPVQLKGEARRGCHGDIGNGRVCCDSTKWPSMVVVGTWAFEGLLRQLAHARQNAPRCTHAPSTTVLGLFVESERTRPFPISQWHTLRVPPNGNASRWPGCGCAISAQSRLHLKGISHLEIAFRLRIRYQAAQWYGRVAERAEHATERSETVGISPIR